MTLKAIIVGAGKAGATLHLDAYRHVKDVEVFGICDIDYDLANEVARNNDIPRAFTSLEEAFTVEHADIVSICTPPSTHFELATSALRLGSCPLIEKPMFQSLDEADTFHRQLTATKGKFAVVHNKKYHRGIQEAVKAYEKGLLGRVNQVHSVWMVNGDENRMTRDPDAWCHSLPGGRWQEMIAHPIYQAYPFVGPMKLSHVEMKSTSGNWPWLPADELDILLESNDGFINVKLSANTRKYRYMLLYGTKRLLYVDHLNATSMLDYALPGARTLLRGFLRTLSTRLRPPSFGGGRKAGSTASGHAELIRELTKYLSGDIDEPPISWDEAYNTLELTLAIGDVIRRKAEQSTA